MIRRPPRSTLFPTRRSSDLPGHASPPTAGGQAGLLRSDLGAPRGEELADLGDRKSTRLNSSHSQISYAVFCLKKKNPRHAHGGIILPFGESDPARCAFSLVT